MSVETVSLRERLLDAAIEILGTEGGAGLTVRAVAKAAGCSTMGVYTHFNGKSGLLDAIVQEGFDDFDAHVANAIDGIENGWRQLARGAVVYRDWALTHRTQYQVMFSPIPGYEPAPETIARGQESFARHAARVERALGNGDIPGPIDDPDTVAAHVWASIHGHVMVAIAQGVPDDDARTAHWFERSVAWTLHGPSHE